LTNITKCPSISFKISGTRLLSKTSELLLFNGYDFEEKSAPLVNLQSSSVSFGTPRDLNFSKVSAL
jgi:hypothetical protein